MLRSFLRLWLSFMVGFFVLGGNVIAANAEPIPKSKLATQITRKEHQLELELYKVRAEINGLEKKQAYTKVAGLHSGGQVYNITQGHRVSVGESRYHLVKESQRKHLASKNDSVEFSSNPLLGVSSDVDLRIHQAAINYMNGVTLLTSPILGLKSAWTPTDLLYTVPSMNEDLRLLRDREGFEKILNEMGGTLNQRPLIVFSGGIEGSLLYTRGYTGQDSITANLNTAEMDIWPIISAWANGFFSVNFDSTPPQTGTRTANSRLFLSRGFLTVGNLAVCPIYLTAGQMYIPFGRYASAMITAPVTLSLGRANERAVLLGFYRKGLYTEAYVFSGDRRSSGDRIILQSGFNIGYESPSLGADAFDVGLGFLTNLADSQGMENNRLDPGGSVRGTSTQFGGFARTFVAPATNSLNLRHNVGGLDLHSEVTMGKYVFLAEFVTSTTSFDLGDMAFQNHGAIPRALHIELDYNSKRGNIPYTLGFSYGHTWQALAVNLPEQSFTLTLSTSPWKDTQLGIEYRHDINYGGETQSFVGGGGNGNVANRKPVPDVNVGGSRDLVILLLGVYF